jgi:hypothetical protein
MQRLDLPIGLRTGVVMGYWDQPPGRYVGLGRFAPVPRVDNRRIRAARRSAYASWLANPQRPVRSSSGPLPFTAPHSTPERAQGKVTVMGIARCRRAAAPQLRHRLRDA